MSLLHAAAIFSVAMFGGVQAPTQEAAGPAQAKGAQPNARYELGWRVRQLERAWAANDDVEKRKLALPHIEAAVQHFFGLRIPAAAEALDLARLPLVPRDSKRTQCNWNDSWAFTPERRLVDSKLQELKLDMTQFYRPCNMQDVVVTGVFEGESIQRYSCQAGADIGSTPELDTLGLAGAEIGDRRFNVSLFNGDFVLSERSLTISIVDKRDERLSALEAALDKLPDNAPRLERESAKALLTLLKSLAAASTEETDYPGARLLAEAEQVVAAAAKGERWYESTKTGQFWLAVPTSEKRTTRARILVPALASDAPKPPLVVALHGAGGSENLFFDGYGDGEIVRQCEKRGWMLVAPRLGFGGAPIAALVDELATRFSFDTARVFVVGHSMGAAAGTSVVLADPARYRAFAALGGGQGLKDAAPLKGLPIFVAAGERDFALPGAKKLHASLVAAGSERAVLRVVPNTEHLMIVQDALPEVFAFFDELARARADSGEPTDQRTDR
jgi:pimeloyl-ACP methyl ester carboxylesterase